MKDKDKGMSALGCGLVWFGAAVSIAEIEAGAALAPAAAGGRSCAVFSAILLGHLLGGALLFLAMLLGARTRRGGMDCAKVPFGRAGGGFFAALNLLQLVGWTAVMVAQGAGAAGELFVGRVPFAAACAGIGALVAVWIYVGLRGVGRINSVAMGLLFALTVLLFVSILGSGAKGTGPAIEPMEGPVFWFVFEMSAAMPLSGSRSRRTTRRTRAGPSWRAPSRRSCTRSSRAGCTASASWRRPTDRFPTPSATSGRRGSARLRCSSSSSRP